MQNEIIYLKDAFEGIISDAYLTSYVHGVSNEIEPDRKRTTVLICPGGGYCMTSDREAEPIALAFLAKGFNAFVLRYSVSPAKYPTQLIEASAAIAYIRRNAERFHVQSDSIAICGFSSGGHLACSVGALWQEKVISDTLGIKTGENRPDGLILGYPVITSGEHAHRGSFEVLSGGTNEPELLHKLSLENSVGKHTPPAFIWHTLNDNCVPSENSLLLANALKKSGVPFELHIYPDGTHGLALANRETRSSLCDRINPHVESWFALCAAWLERYISKGA